MVDPLLVLAGIPAVLTTSAASVTIYRHLKSLQREAIEDRYQDAVREFLGSWQTSAIEYTNIDPVEMTPGTYFTEASRWIGGFKHEALSSSADILTVDNLLEAPTSQDIITIGGPASRALARISLSYDESGTLDESNAPRLVYQSIGKNKGGAEILESYDWGKTHQLVPANAVVDLKTGREYFPKLDNAKLKTDLCLLTVRPNPFNNEHRHWVIGGTNGVSAVAFGRALFQKAFVTKMCERTEGERYFQILLECPVKWLKGGGYVPVLAPRLLDVLPIPPGTLSPQAATERFRKIAQLQAGRMLPRSSP